MGLYDITGVRGHQCCSVHAVLELKRREQSAGNEQNTTHTHILYAHTCVLLAYTHSQTLRHINISVSPLIYTHAHKQTDAQIHRTHCYSLTHAHKPPNICFPHARIQYHSHHMYAMTQRHNHVCCTVKHTHIHRQHSSITARTVPLTVFTHSYTHVHTHPHPHTQQLCVCGFIGGCMCTFCLSAL